MAKNMSSLNMLENALAFSAPTALKRRPGTLAVSLAVCMMAAACTTSSDPGAGLRETRPAVVVDMAALPGNYGLAAYHRDEDAERTLQQAKIACNNPYTIGAGPNGGVLMHYVGQSQPSEVFFKRGKNGQAYIGPKGPTGVPQDREVVSYDDGVLVVRWVDERAREVYGTLIYLPCGQA